jgi:hypothetical protein
MDERNHSVSTSAARLLVDQFDTEATKVLEGRLEIVDFIRDVVESFSSLREKVRNDRVRSGRAEQLKVRVPNREHHLFDTVVRDQFAMVHGEAPRFLVVRDRNVEVGNRKRNMVDPQTHGGILEWSSGNQSDNQSGSQSKEQRDDLLRDRFLGPHSDR